ncbi:MAG: ribonuclease III [Candidatus Marinimicrobia bacterium]|nr:ribonuclease III [Candidatus Neomarinimicrobiota bacterium]|tara:strand:+ start:7943 stop:8674 length:732 start_codon:yes stop_codon:yes gene_type:complete
MGLNQIIYIHRLISWRFLRKDKSLYQLQNSLGYFFQNPSLLNAALTHKSKETKASKNYEQLEFLGDAILDHIISEMLFIEFPQAGEGFLTEKRASLVQKSFLSKMGHQLDLLKYIISGSSLNLKIKKNYEKQLCNVFEALIGAIKLDGGINPCIDLVKKTVWKNRHEAWKTINFKGKLIEYCQANSLKTPRFIVADTEGPDHEKVFKVEVHLGSSTFSSASAPTKKAAEQIAAEKTLIKIKTN